MSIEATLVEGHLSHEIIGASMKVHNTLGPGLLEKVYENALVIALRKRGFDVTQQKAYKVLYEGEEVGEYIPDILVEDRIIIDTKSIEAIGDIERAKMIHYGRISDKALGLIINFANEKLEWVRILHPEATTISR